MAAKRKRLRPIHPGEILREEFLVPLNMTPNILAARLRVPSARITKIVQEERPITVETAVRLARFFGTTPELWLGLQQAYDLKTLPKPLLKEVERDITPHAA